VVFRFDRHMKLSLRAQVFPLIGSSFSQVLYQKFETLGAPKRVVKIVRSASRICHPRACRWHPKEAISSVLPAR